MLCFCSGKSQEDSIPPPAAMEKTADVSYGKKEELISLYICLYS